jgi:hypothetical protein
VNMEALHVGGGRQRTSHSQSSTYSHAVLHAPAMAPAASSDSDGGPNMRGMDSNLGALCEHVQLEGWKSKAFSDIVVNVMGHTFHLQLTSLSKLLFQVRICNAYDLYEYLNYGSKEKARRCIFGRCILLS